MVTQANRRGEDMAYERLLRLAGDSGYIPRLRLMACLAAVRVLFRLGRYQAARKTLIANNKLVEAVDDRVLTAHYHLALAWSHMRGSSGGPSNRASEKALSAAREYAEDSGDRTSIGLLAYYTSMYLTKKGKHRESIEQLLQAVEAALVTGNYDAVQAYCGDLGSVIHRLGPKHYKEARSWLLLGIAVARWMKIGWDDAHGEMILGKIYTERGIQPRLARSWLQRAERIAQRSGNQVNSADVKMVWAFWHQRFVTPKAQIDTLVQALLIFRSPVTSTVARRRDTWHESFLALGGKWSSSSSHTVALEPLKRERVFLVAQATHGSRSESMLEHGSFSEGRTI
jgi:hypothetical protein